MKRKRAKKQAPPTITKATFMRDVREAIDRELRDWVNQALNRIERRVSLSWEPRIKQLEDETAYERKIRLAVYEFLLAERMERNVVRQHVPMVEENTDAKREEIAAMILQHAHGLGGSFVVTSETKYPAGNGGT